MTSPKKVFFKTFGCKTNLADTAMMRGALGEGALAGSEEEAECVVVNSCTVTHGADAGVRRYVRRMERMGKRVYLTGCGVDGVGRELFLQQRVHGVFGGHKKVELSWMLQKEERFFLEDQYKWHKDAPSSSPLSLTTRGFLKIQEGCDGSCSYCVIPSVRGGARSMEEASLLHQAALMAEQGVREVVLTGTHCGSYGRERGSSLAALLPKLASFGFKRIRIGSLESHQIDSGLLELLEEPWMARHLHIALQHTSDALLERMNRPNRYRSDQRLLEELASRGYALGTDLIVGHPGESEEEYAFLLERVEALPLTHLHAFVFSPRAGTPAASMHPQVPVSLARDRQAEVLKIVAQKNNAFRRRTQGPLAVLVDQEEEGGWSGLDQFYNRVVLRSEGIQRGDFVEVEHY